MIRLATCLTLCCLGSGAHADLTVQFIEGAPKDQFVLTNDGVCDMPETTVTLDLDAADTGLLFDMTVAGAGVGVAQPFEVTEGRNRVLGLPDLADGDTVVSLNLSGLHPGEQVAFTLDVDSTQSSRPTTVTGSAMEGAMITAVFGEDIRKAAFTDEARAVLMLDACIG